MLEKFPSPTRGGKICDSCIPVESNLDESCDDDVDIVAILANKINWNQSMSACKPLEKPQLSKRSLCTQVTKKKRYVNKRCCCK